MIVAIRYLRDIDSNLYSSRYIDFHPISPTYPTALHLDIIYKDLNPTTFISGSPMLAYFFFHPSVATNRPAGLLMSRRFFIAAVCTSSCTLSKPEVRNHFSFWIVTPRVENAAIRCLFAAWRNGTPEVHMYFHMHVDLLLSSLGDSEFAHGLLSATRCWGLTTLSSPDTSANRLHGSLISCHRRWSAETSRRIATQCQHCGPRAVQTAPEGCTPYWDAFEDR